MTTRIRAGTCALLVAVFAWSTLSAFQRTGSASAAAATDVGPKYDPDGALQLPADYRTWVFVGSSLGLSYADGAPGMEMFEETLMEPTAYRHVVATGTFREGTMFAAPSAVCRCKSS